jgi:hypothetical protein
MTITETFSTSLGDVNVVLNIYGSLAGTADYPSTPGNNASLVTAPPAAHGFTARNDLALGNPAGNTIQTSAATLLQATQDVLTCGTDNVSQVSHHLVTTTTPVDTVAVELFGSL